MANIVTMALCRIKDNKKLEYNTATGADKTYTLYSSMLEILAESADKYIQGDFEFEIIENEVDSYQEIFDTNFNEVYQMWDNGNNNVLFLDLDTLVINPVDVFDKLSDFQMFNYTDPKTLSGKDATNKYELQHEHYFNAGVRYYPSSMKKEVWDLGWKYANDWDYNVWGTEQIIFNEMMYSQDSDHTKWLTPEMNYQMMNATPPALEQGQYISQLNAWNGTSLNTSQILHLHGTRGAEQTLLTQWALWKKLTGEEFEFDLVNVIKNNDGMPVGIEYK
jgi:hypothetical protein